jgi:hypothetical protein
LEGRSGIDIAVENMYPMRADALLGRGGAQRMLRRGGPGPAFSAYYPSTDPTDVGHAHYTLDFSHAVTAGTRTAALADRMGKKLRHLHIGDGTGAPVDEHLLPGTGIAPIARVCGQLVAEGFGTDAFPGAAAVEVNTHRAETAAERAAMLKQALAFSRVALAPAG